MFNGYDDSGVKPEAKAAVQVRAAPCLAGGVYAGALHAIIFSHVQVAPVAMSSFQTNSHVINGILAVFDPSLSSTRTCWTVGTGGCQRKVELNDLLAADSCERTLLWGHPPPGSCGVVVKPPTSPSAGGAGGRQRDLEHYRLCAHNATVHCFLQVY